MDRKAQMFVVTLIFMAEMIFIVQQSLFQYSSIPVTGSFGDFPKEALESTRIAANRTVKAAGGCAEATENMAQLESFLGNRTLPAYSLDLSYSINCNNWGNSYPQPEALNLTVSAASIGVELSENYRIYHGAG